MDLFKLQKQDESAFNGWYNKSLAHQEPRSKKSEGMKSMIDEEQRQSVRKEDTSNIVSLLKACAREKNVGQGSKLHVYIRKHAFLERNSYVASALIHMYARCGALEKAQQVLDELPIPLCNVVTWNALIAGYSQQGQGEEALKCLASMEYQGYSPDEVTFTCALKACGSIGAAGKGEEIHDRLAHLGMLEKDILLGNSLVDMYAKCGVLAKAQQVLDEIPVRNVVAWTALLVGYVQQGQGEKALKCFKSMQHEGHSPDVVTFACALRACGSIGALVKGKEIHAQIVSLGMLEKDTVLKTTLVDMYAKCGALIDAQQAFNDLPVRTVVAWTAIIAGYSQQGQSRKALSCFECMQQEGHSPDVVTFICALKACASIGDITRGELIHENIVDLHMLEKEVVLANTLVDMYARCGAITKAQHVLNELSMRNVITWNTLIAALAEQGQGEEALKCFDNMQCDGQFPDAVTFICALKACGSIGASAKGEEFHDKIVHLGMLEKDLVLGNIIVDMYAKCGVLEKAQQVFNKLFVRNVISWTALMAGYAHSGQGDEALNCFEKMQSKGVRPDSTTLFCVFNTCSHAGLLDQAKFYFSRMSEYCILPDIEHLCCIIDLFGRAGKLDMALDVSDKISFSDHLPFWLSLLGAACKWVNVKIGRLAFEHAFCIDKNNASAYVCIANIYTAVAMQEYAERIE